MLKIETIKNEPVSSNCYIISNDCNNTCVIVDPGTKDCKELLNILQTKNFIPEFIILTHEHIDHTIGIEELLKHYAAKIICSMDCNNHINSLKYNLTGFTDKFEEKSNLPTASNVFGEDNFLLEWGDFVFHFYKAQGHSMGSIFFNIGNNLFLGDTFIKGYKTITTLPGGSNEKLKTTLERILSIFDKNIIKVYSGHYDAYYLNEIEAEIKDQIEFLNIKIQKIQKNKNQI